MRHKTNEEYLQILQSLHTDLTHMQEVWEGNTSGLNIPDVISNVRFLQEALQKGTGEVHQEWNELANDRYGPHASVAGCVAEVFALLVLGGMKIYSSARGVQDRVNQSDKKIDILFTKPHWKREYSAQVKACIVSYDSNAVKMYTNYFDGEADRLFLIDIERGWYVLGDREELKMFCLDYMKEYNTDKIPLTKFKSWANISGFISTGTSEEIQQLSKKIGV